MKGIVFTEFLDFVDTSFSPDTTEEMVIACDLPSNGAYTSIQSYDHSELLRLVGELARRTGETVPRLVCAFGRYLFTALHSGLPTHLKAGNDLFGFLDSVDSLIHSEVRKLDPDAALPQVTCERLSPSRMSVRYSSCCPFSDLAMGLLEACAEHFGEKASIVQIEGRAASESATFLIQLSEGSDDES